MRASKSILGTLASLFLITSCGRLSHPVTNQSGVFNGYYWQQIGLQGQKALSQSFNAGKLAGAVSTPGCNILAIDAREPELFRSEISRLYNDPKNLPISIFYVENLVQRELGGANIQDELESARQSAASP